MSISVMPLAYGNTIQNIGTEFPNPTNEFVIDVAGRTMMPGFVDNHVHVFMNGIVDMLESFENPNKLNNVAAKRAEKMLMRRFRLFGTLVDRSSRGFQINRRIDQGKTGGSRIDLSRALISQTSANGDTRLPNEKSRSFLGVPFNVEILGVNFIAGGRPSVLTAVHENLRKSIRTR